MKSEGEEKLFHKFIRRFVVILLIISVISVLIIIYELCTHKATIIDVAIIVTAATASISVFYLAEQIRTSAEQLKIDRSHEYITKFSDVDFTTSILKARNFLRDEKTTGPEKENILKNSTPEIQAPVSSLLSFFEGMAIIYNRNGLDKNLINEFFLDASVKIYRESYEPFIKYVQAQVPQAYKNWKAMNNELREFGVKKFKKDA